MAPRAYWKGYLKLSLVSCPIALSPATSASERVAFRQGDRLGPVAADDPFDVILSNPPYIPTDVISIKDSNFSVSGSSLRAR